MSELSVPDRRNARKVAVFLGVGRGRTGCGRSSSSRAAAFFAGRKQLINMMLCVRMCVAVQRKSKRGVPRSCRAVTRYVTAVRAVDAEGLCECAQPWRGRKADNAEIDASVDGGSVRDGGFRSGADRASCATMVLFRKLSSSGGAWWEMAKSEECERCTAVGGGGKSRRRESQRADVGWVGGLQWVVERARALPTSRWSEITPCEASRSAGQRCRDNGRKLLLG